MSDDLFDVRNNFYLGAFSSAIREGEASSNTSPEKSVFVYRSHIGLGDYETVIAEVADDAAPEVQGVRLLAQYLQARENSESTAPFVETMDTWVQERGNSAQLLVIAASLYAIEGNRDQCMRVANQSTELEAKAILVQQYLGIGRVELAEKEYRKMCQMDEDATITQLAGAWVSLHRGGDKIQEAFYIFQELSEKYGRSAMVLNGMALCHMHKQMFEEAETLLVEALEKSPKDADTLSNLVVCTQHQNKPPARYLRQLKGAAPQHPFVEEHDTFVSALERAASRYAPVQ